MEPTRAVTGLEAANAPAMAVDHVINALQLRRVRQGAVATRAPSTIFELTGAGAADCLQGILTNDVLQPGPGRLVYGALLTPKGMIAVDLWVLRLSDRFLLLTGPQGRERAIDIFGRTLPPRLAKARDVSDTHAVAWLLGEQIGEILADGGDLPLDAAPGMVREVPAGGETIFLARPEAAAPFAFLLAGAAGGVDAKIRELQDRGALPGEASDLEAARILSGWPALGVEIDDRTLPQEVRFDELGGVSYTKGCYIGQETVARVHFRGHPNRMLRGLTWQTPAALEGREIVTPERQVGMVRSTLELPDRRIGLAILRREVDPGTQVIAAGRPALVVTLPFGGEDLNDLQDGA